MSSFPLDADQYELIKPIGKGATADVYVARCKANNETLAVKVIDLETCPIEIETLRREVAFWSACKHENVVGYYGSFASGSKVYILMEYMSAGSCYEIMKFGATKHFTDEAVIAKILYEVLQALAYFHENRQIHRDIKAGNILIGESGSIKIGDFGIAANLLEQGQRKRARFTVIGTPCYMAPEILKEEEGYTEKADIWSLGITAIELATGHAPYSTMYPMEVIVKVLNSPPPQLPSEPKFSSAFRDFVKQCLVFVPAKRPTAKHLLEHKFFKQRATTDEFVQKVIRPLPPLPQRFELTHSRQAKASPRSNPSPIKAEWDFDGLGEEDVSSSKEPKMENGLIDGVESDVNGLKERIESISKQREDLKSQLAEATSVLSKLVSE